MIFHKLLNIKINQIATGALILLFPVAAIAQNPGLSSSDTNLLSAFIFNIVKFVEWNGEKTKLSKGDKIRISVMTNDDILANLERLTKDKVIENHKIEILPFDPSDSRSNVLVLIPTDKLIEKQTIKKFKGCQCLIMTYGNSLAKEGSVINFFTEDDRFRFEINLERAKEENLELSSRILQLGKIVK